MAIPGPKTKITFYKPKSSGTDHFGNPIYSDSKVCEVGAVVQALTGNDRFVGGKPDVLSSHRLFVDVDDNTRKIVEGMKVVIPFPGTRGDATFEVVFIDEPGLLAHHIEIMVNDLGTA